MSPKRYPSTSSAQLEMSPAEKSQGKRCCEVLDAHSPFWAQVATFILSSVGFALCLVAQFHDLEWNQELKTPTTKNLTLYNTILAAFLKNSNSSKTLERRHVFREHREFVLSLLIQAYVLSAISFHMINYWISTNAAYRVHFGRFLNFGLTILCAASILLMLIAMLEINGNYEELKHIQMFSKCQFGEESEEVNVSLTVKQKELACQRYDLRFSAIALIVLDGIIMIAIILFANTKPETLDKMEDTRDLDYTDEDDDRRRVSLSDENRVPYSESIEILYPV